jgi:Phytanoyl-CoA dioxygenase (PhyH)
LFLFTDVDDADAPTRIRVGSHLDIPQVLAPYGEDGVSIFHAAQQIDAASAHRPLALATGSAGDVFVCHPFLVHAAQPHHGTRPRFLAQPPIAPAVPLNPFGPLVALLPVELAIRRGLGS